MSYVDRLLERQEQLGRPVRVGLVGAGQMGRGFVAQLDRIPGLSVSAVADPMADRAAGAYRNIGSGSFVEGDDVDTLSQAVLDGRGVALTSAALLPQLPVDIVVEATGVPTVGAEVAFANLLAGKDVAMLNVECDVTVGPLLRDLAHRTGSVYTVCHGDEPVEATKLVEFARDLAFEVVCAGKGKNNPLVPEATPASLEAEALSKGMNPKMLCSFVDGSKAMIEMAALANGTGLEVSKRGMHGPYSTVETLQDTFALAEDGGVLDRPGVVDYCTGPVAPGVFVVVKASEGQVREEMSYLKMGKGPYFALYRPYHLASIEAPISVMEAVLDRRASLEPRAWTAEVITVAKRDLAEGEVLGGIGGTDIRGLIDSAAQTQAEGLLPLGVAQGATMLTSVAAGTPLSYSDVALDDSSTIVALRRLQDRLGLAR